MSLHSCKIKRKEAGLLGTIPPFRCLELITLLIIFLGWFTWCAGTYIVEKNMKTKGGISFIVLKLHELI